MAVKKDYQVGDIVKLKSGGPCMTVETVYEGGNIYCAWFAGTKLNNGSFAPDSLVHAEADDDDET